MTLYGITEIGLSDQLNITKAAATSLINQFKKQLPNFLRWESETHREVLTNGYVKDLFGRKRRFKETILKATSSSTFKNKNSDWRLEKIKRQSCNFKIQGTSATQVKKAMVNLFYPTRPDGTKCLDRDEWLQENYKSILEEHDIHIVLQIHDELIFDVPQDVSQDVLKEISNIMLNAIPSTHLGVTFHSDIHTSPYWGGTFSMEEIKEFSNSDVDLNRLFHQQFKQKINNFLNSTF
ncbi:DNA polymerase [Bacillus cereus]|uniref:DNA polymerase n=1 Tax=Bacillus cereus group sp. Bce019 TaxID=3445247 RepID=UPI003F20786B|nr:DNA polymerase [Bacillus cereus]MDA2343303.1 DNA polymerase [Bacillus cereus]MDA2347986.1 DNA polymerase [Bacillus cereus]